MNRSTVYSLLKSTGDDRIFGAGDIATQVNNPRPKAGVFAVRQGPVLASNLRAIARGQPLREHHPQRRFLSLLSLGHREAVADRNGLSLRGAWVWRWKDRIDRKFMARFSDLPERRMDGAGDAGGQAVCGGCGAKVGGRSLADALAALSRSYPQVVSAAELAEDATAVSVSGPLLQSTD